MEDIIQEFIDYIHRTKHSSSNTEVSYMRDLKKLMHYLQTQGITSWGVVTFTT